MSSKNKHMVINDLLKDFNVRTEDELQDKPNYIGAAGEVS